MVAAAVMGAATVASSAMSASASRKAAKTQAESADRASQIQKEMYDQTRKDLDPYTQAGTNALGQLQSGMKDGTFNNNYQGDQFSFNGSNSPYYSSNGSIGDFRTARYSGPSYSASQFNAAVKDTPAYKSNEFNFEESPDYQYRLKQGMDGIQSSAAASGGLLSGSALKALNSHNSNLASQEFSNAYGRYLQNENLLQSQQAQEYNQFLGNQGLLQAQAQLGLQQYATEQGLRQSGNAQNLANQNFLSNQHQQAFQNWQSQDNNAYSRYMTDQNNQYNRLLGLIGIGQNSAAQVGANGMSTAQSVANNTMAGANALAAGQIGSANAWTDGAQQLGTLATAYANNKKSGVV